MITSPRGPAKRQFSSPCVALDWQPQNRAVVSSETQRLPLAGVSVAGNQPAQPLRLRPSALSGDTHAVSGNKDKWHRLPTPTIGLTSLTAPGPQYYYYYEYMKKRINEIRPGLPEPVVDKLLAYDADELDLILSHPAAARDQVGLHGSCRRVLGHQRMMTSKRTIERVTGMYAEHIGQSEQRGGFGFLPSWHLAGSVYLRRPQGFCWRLSRSQSSWASTRSTGTSTSKTTSPVCFHGKRSRPSRKKRKASPGPPSPSPHSQSGNRMLSNNLHGPQDPQAHLPV